jgi:DNA excision repair protein ERCC-3
VDFERNGSRLGRERPSVLSKLRDYQTEGWKKFLETGAVGVYWPFGMGKTVLGIYAIAHLKGRKLVVCPTRTLVEQWEDRLQKWLSLGLRHDVRVVTYHSWEKVKDEDWTLVVFDEAHRLPANTFSRLASLRTKYRIGLSATPHREDGRENFIVALTGFPIGVDWTSFIRSGLIKKPDIEIRIVRNWTEKLKIAETEAKVSKGSSIVFCDSIALGAQAAARLKCPHVHGETTKRLEILKGAKTAVVSRVGDEGLSLENLTKVVEIDFHGGSRRQESSQRVGRLFHAEGDSC